MASPRPSTPMLLPRDRRDAQTVSRRPQSACLDELFSDGFPQIYSNAEFKAIVRLPREVFSYWGEKIASDCFHSACTVLVRGL